MSIESTQQTLAYYEQHADAFSANTLHASMAAQLKRFLAYVPAGGTVLDWGCGSGRDAKELLDAGYEVTAADACAQLCERAGKLTGLSVRRQEFLELVDAGAFDGIWACASLLHLTPTELPRALELAGDALKDGGVLYASFKYGTHVGMRDGRWFTDLDETTFTALLPCGLAPLELWTSADVRAGRHDERWLNALVQKTVC